MAVQSMSPSAAATRPDRRGPRLRSPIPIALGFALALAATSIDGARAQNAVDLPPLPGLVAEALDGTRVTLPDSIRGSVALLGFAFAHDHRQTLDRWMEPLIQALEGRPDFRHYQIPLMGSGAARTFRGLINGRMRRGLPAGRRGTVLPYYEEFSAYARQLDMIDRSRVYLFLLDREGRIAWRASGGPSTQQQVTLHQAATRLLGQAGEVQREGEVDTLLDSIGPEH